MEERPEKCRHGFIPEMCAICKGHVTRDSQTKSYGKVRKPELEDMDDETDETEKEPQYDNLENMLTVEDDEEDLY